MNWTQLATTYGLGPEQLACLQQYQELVMRANEQFNLTALTDESESIAYHMADSLELGKVIDLTQISALADVGTGAGFPGMVLKIKYPHLRLFLLEVSRKKCDFLRTVAHTLGLASVEVIDLDWRTFLRNTAYGIDLFCARASLQPEELVRMFKPSCPYRDARLVYWASAAWEPSRVVQPYVRAIVPYQIEDRKRKYSICGRVS